MNLFLQTETAVSTLVTGETLSPRRNSESESIFLIFNFLFIRIDTAVLTLTLTRIVNGLCPFGFLLILPLFLLLTCLCERDYDCVCVCVYLFLEKVLSVLQGPQVVLLVFVFHLVTRWLEVANQIL